MDANHTWPLFTLRQTLSNLVFYINVPGDETGTDEWEDATRRDVKERFASAIDAGVMERDTLVARQTDALTLISILHHNPGMKRKDWGADIPSEARKLREFCDHLKTLEGNASDEGEHATEPEPAKPNATTATNGTEGDDTLSNLPDDAMMNHRDLAAVLKLDAEPLRKRLDRWRKRNGDGWQELTEATSKEPRYLYQVRAVREVLREAIGTK